MRVFEKAEIWRGAAREPLQGELRVGGGRVCLWVEGAETWGVAIARILLHAVSADAAAFPRKCVYCQIDGGDSSGDGGAEEDDIGVEEVRLVVKEEEVEQVFRAMCEEAAAEGEGEDEDESVLEEMERTRSETIARLDRLVVEGNEERFEDADDDQRDDTLSMQTNGHSS